MTDTRRTVQTRNGPPSARPRTLPHSDPTLRLDDPAGSSRAHGLRRLSRLTWRTTQLSAIAAAAFAVLFARTRRWTCTSPGCAESWARRRSSPRYLHTVRGVGIKLTAPT